MNPASPFAKRNFVEHKIASSETDSMTALKYEYLLAGNGLFIRAKRAEFSVCLPLARLPVSNLPIAASGIVWHKPQIPVAVWQEILSAARRASPSTDFREDVFIVFWSERDTDWKWFRISREREWGRTLADDTLPEYGTACIELHTHPPGAIHFSATDDEDEKDKFRLFGILTDVHTIRPKIRFRLGVYQHFVQVPAFQVSEMPIGITDLNQPEAAR